MTWATWILDPEVKALERELSSIGTAVIEGEEYVRIGSFSRTKIFDIDTFKRTATAILKARAGGGADTRGQRGRGRSRTYGSQSQGSGITLGDVESASSALYELAVAALGERDEWRARAIDAETRLASSNAPAARPRSADIDKIKRLLARELHPDAAPDEGEKQIRAKLFQQIWPLIEQLESS
jgi:hypothetical protein